MSKVITTQIDGVPVELEILNVGPASPDDIQRLSENLAHESSVKPAKVRVIKVGTDEKPATPEEIKKIEAQVENTPAEMIGSLIENLSNVEEGKAWWQSKTIWVNIAAIVGSVGAMFGLNIPLDPELCMTLFPVILGVVNLILRGKTNKPLKSSINKTSLTSTASNENLTFFRLIFCFDLTFGMPYFL